MPAILSPDWLIERGIGECRAVRIGGGEIVATRVLLDGIIAAGTVLEAKLLRQGKPAIAEALGQEYVLRDGAGPATEGQSIVIEITREAIPGGEHWKRPLAKLSSEAPREPAIEAEALQFPSPHDRLEEFGWADLLEEARSGIVAFAGGALRVSPTPAMTLIDVDGNLPPLELAMAGAKAAARTILRHGIGGSIGIDLPTVQGKEQRTAIGAAVDTILTNPFERTAVNGFGFLQIIRPRLHASLFELAADRPAFEARALLRQASTETGAITLAANPAVVAVLENQADWIETLARHVGGPVSLRSDARFTMSGGHAEKS
ncbi:ribonuclease [Sphingomonas alba]|uniref:Ribonuclease n=1 Tax=Sphingomonas alba TaxID=2908208 RepID=A0ABT0RLX8_9SPHN|nr:ribonuclease [Sphingomonas alba]MCL6683648.1 ribonuclease [Sphingomonas alba]